jgi:predicted ATP-dependent endonuclease of OLD family
MKLSRYRVTNFRSVEDSGWIDCEDVTTLVGVNEAGKSNLLLALWKLNPAKGGEINLLSDLPRSKYSELRDKTKGLEFIQTEFELTDDLVSEIVKITGASSEDVRIASVSRDFYGTRRFGFPNGKAPSSLNSTSLIDNLATLKFVVEKVEETEDASETKEEWVRYVNQLETVTQGKLTITSQQADSLQEILQNAPETFPSDDIQSAFEQLETETLRLKGQFTHPINVEGSLQLLVDNLPSFVYYSNYGNLDSEIYLPHVIENLKRDDLTGTAEAKARTLRVLFEFVNLNPQEVLDLGAEPEPTRHPQNQSIVQPPSEEAIKAAANKKAERNVLLQSASANLTKRFRDWWKQGEHNFEFVADGKHFRILVSDDKRPEKVELESRSTGLQWFFSFFLVFLVESQDSHKGSLLLLDEAGLSLHPLAQKDLSKFFDNLSSTNQIIHTTHSPFLVDTNHVDRAKVVYVDDSGHTVASSNLRAGLLKPHKGSIYAIHAALGLSVSDALLQGCRPIIVEGPSDQFYLSGIKNYLINRRLIAPLQELIFIPSGGVKGLEAISAIVSGKDEQLPIVLLDSDSAGKGFKTKLQGKLYKEALDRVLEVNDFIDIENAEFEDLIPLELLKNALNKMFRNVDDESFEDIYDENKALVPQIEDFARTHSVQLEHGWKVELSKYAKGRLISPRLKSLSESYPDRWKRLFEKFIAD